MARDDAAGGHEAAPCLGSCPQGQSSGPLPARWAIVGASVGVIGAIAGLVIGLYVYAPTAPFAVIELGLPATIVGGVVGLAAGVIATVRRRIKRNDARSP